MSFTLYWINLRTFYRASLRSSNPLRRSKKQLQRPLALYFNVLYDLHSLVTQPHSVSKSAFYFSHPLLPPWVFFPPFFFSLFYFFFFFIPSLYKGLFSGSTSQVLYSIRWTSLIEDRQSSYCLLCRFYIEI